MVADGLEEGFTGFQLFKSAAPNSSMAPSYEHSTEGGAAREFFYL